MSVLRGFLAEIRPLPMCLMLGTVILGAVLAKGPFINTSILTLVLINAFCFLYTAHLNDTFFDVRKGEYEEEREFHAIRIDETYYLPRYGFGLEVPNAPILPAKHYLVGIVISSLLGLLAMISVSLLIGWFYSCLAIIGLFLALSYSAGIDRVPALGDTWWELGVIAALFCGYYSQKLVLDEFIIIAGLFLFIGLVGIKLLDSFYDIPIDDKIDKMTLAVWLYRRGWSLTHIRDLAYAFIYTMLVIFFLALPPPFRLPIATCAIIIASSHIQWRKNDMRVRKGIVFGGLGIIILIYWSILIGIGIA